MKATTITTALSLLFAGFATAQVSMTDFADLNGATAPVYTGAAPTSVQAMRSTSWSHPGGNLVANWSFENSQQFWESGSMGNLRVRCTYAKSGYFVGQAKPGTASGAGLTSGMVPIMPDQTYTLSFYHMGSTGGGDIKPRISYFDRAGNAVTSSAGPEASYPSTTAWTLRQIALTPPAGAGFAKIDLVSGTVPAGATTFYFDDVMLTEGAATAPAQDRNSVQTSISISDPSGIALQTASGNGNGANLLVSSLDYDKFWRPEKSYLPFPVTANTALSEIASPLTSAKSAWSAAGNTPFTQIAYPDLSHVSQTRNASTGDLWALNALPAHVAASGSILVSSVPTTSAQMPTESFETYHEASLGEKLYVLNWSRDPDGYYTAQWTDAAGKVVASARQMIQGAGSKPFEWTWAFTTYQYFPNGRLKSVTDPPTANGQVPPTITSYDFQGRVVAKSSPDEGLIRYWYDQAGRLRYWQTAKASAEGWLGWRRYDVLGRPVVEGTSKPVTGLDVQSLAETPGSEQNPAYFVAVTPQKGWIYDNLSTDTFQVRTGVSLSTVVGSATFAGANGNGRLVAKYNLNPHFAATPTGGVDVTSPAARLVVDLYSYDGLGRQKVSGKYIGAITDAALRSQSVEYRYDSLGRVEKLLVDKNMAQTLLSDGLRAEDASYSYTYDGKNQITQVTDGTQNVARYTYNGYGQTTAVGMGGSGVSNALGVQMAYDFKGRLKSMSTNGANVQQQQELIGYEAPVISPTATGITPTPRYAGQISQIVQQFGTDQNLVDPAAAKGSQSVKAVHYNYDAQGRMVNVQTFRPKDPVTYGQGGVAYLEVPYNTASEPALSARYEYDVNDRIQSVKWGNSPTSLWYTYKAASNRLDNASGMVVPGSTRNASAVGNFMYDADGGMISDVSRSNTYKHDYAGKLLSIYKSLSNQQSSLHTVYDADGYMVSYTRISANPGAQGMESKHHYIRINGRTFKEYHETWTPGTTTTPSVYKSTATVVNLYGRSSVIGRKFPGTSLQRQFLVKDHQGSTVRLVNEDGTVAGAYDYYAYGDLRVLTGEATNLTSKWTGKEDFAEFGLMYFGARWYDPELGTWISPDPVHQFSSPYAYGSRPHMGGDGNGLFWDDIWDGITTANDAIQSGFRFINRQLDDAGVDDLVGDATISVNASTDGSKSVSVQPSGAPSPVTVKFGGETMDDKINRIYRENFSSFYPRLDAPNDLWDGLGSSTSFSESMARSTISLRLRNITDPWLRGDLAKSMLNDAMIGTFTKDGVRVAMCEFPDCPERGLEYDIGPGLMLGGAMSRAAISLVEGISASRIAMGAVEVTEARARMAAVRQAGREGEAMQGFPKNSEHIPSATGTAAYRVPDGLDHVERIIKETKNVNYLRFTPQLQDYLAYAKANNYRFELSVRPTTQLARALEAEIRAGNIFLKTLY